MTECERFIAEGKFSKEFFNSEVRCGFLVDEKRKKIWAIELDLLREFDCVCKKYDIKYQLFCGSLLGAVRHGGFIPWDDDLDVCIDRNNYMKLLKVAFEFSEPYFLQTAINDRQHFIGYARLRNSRTTGWIAHMNSPNYNQGIYIDIYVLDRRFSVGIFRFIQNRLMSLPRVMMISYYRNPKEYFRGNITAKVVGCLMLFSHFLSYEFYWKIYFWMTGLCPKMACGTIAQLCEPEKDQMRYYMLVDEIEDSVMLPFEGCSVPVPRNYKQVLTRIYGNYMEFPPVSERGAWHEGVIHFEPDVPYRQYFQDEE